MRSIREVCSKDYSLAEIRAWAGRPYDEARRRQLIQENLVWVVQHESFDPPVILSPTSGVELDLPPTPQVFGFASMEIDRGNGAPPDPSATAPKPPELAAPTARIQALYFSSEILGLGFGKELVRVMLEEARNAGVKEVILESSITAYPFYKRCGFQDSGPSTAVEINGSAIRCYPMSYRFDEVTAVELG